jgi:hypothetical protein
MRSLSINCSVKPLAAGTQFHATAPGVARCNAGFPLLRLIGRDGSAYDASVPCRVPSLKIYMANVMTALLLLCATAGFNRHPRS